MRGDFKLYLRLLRYIRPYWRTVIISVLAMMVSAGLEPALPALMQPLIDKNLIQREGSSLWQIPLFIALVFLLKGVADYVANVASQTVAQKTIADLRNLIFSHQLDLPINLHSKEESGRMLSRVTYDTNMVGEAVSTAWLTIVRDTLVVIGLLGFLFYTAWQLTLMVLLMAPVLAFSIRHINRKLRHSSERVQGWMGRVTGLVEEALLGLREIKIFNAHSYQAKRFDRVNQDLRREQMRVVRVQALNVPLVQMLAACSVAVVIYGASSLGSKDLLTPGEFVAFITAMSMFFEPVRRLTNVNAALQRGLAAAESIFTMLDHKGEEGLIRPDETPYFEYSFPEKKPSSQSLPEIEFRQVSYRYPGAADYVLEDLSLIIKGGELVTLVGPSGSGKSTLLQLLCGFDKPSAGTILIDKERIDDYTTSQLRSKIALVGQQTWLFDASLAENLRIAKPNASESELMESLRLADAQDFVKLMPAGLNTPIGALGHKLSGGQRQRIALARAFLKNAPILLLDESTNALDHTSESIVLDGIQKLSEGKTTIVVSHNPERLQNISRTLRLR